jgi:hypothetical protein
MLSKCANSACGSPFRYLGQGKLFQIETESRDAAFTGEKNVPRKRRALRRVERYWLCDRCSSWLTLAVASRGELVTVPLPSRTKAEVLAAISAPKKYPAPGVGLGAAG